MLVAMVSRIHHDVRLLFICRTASRSSILGIGNDGFIKYHNLISRVIMKGKKAFLSYWIKKWEEITRETSKKIWYLTTPTYHPQVHWMNRIWKIYVVCENIYFQMNYYHHIFFFIYDWITYNNKFDVVLLMT